MAVQAGIEFGAQAYGQFDPASHAEFIGRVVGREAGLEAMLAAVPNFGVPQEKFVTVLSKLENGQVGVMPDPAGTVPQQSGVIEQCSRTGRENYNDLAEFALNEFGEPIIDIEAYTRAFPRVGEVKTPFTLGLRKLDRIQDAIAVRAEPLVKTLEEIELTNKNGPYLASVQSEAIMLGKFSQLLKHVVTELFKRPYNIPEGMPPFDSRVQQAIASAYATQFFSGMYERRQVEYLSIGMAWVVMEATPEGFSSSELNKANKVHDMIRKAQTGRK